MKDRRYLFYCRYVLVLFVFLFVLSFPLQTGYGEEFRSPGALKAKIAQKAMLVSKDHSRLRAAIEAYKRHTAQLMGLFGVVATRKWSTSGERVH